jgi:hypothetical protein
MMSAAALLRWQFEVVHGLLDANGDGLCREAAARYAGVTLCEDMTISGLRAGQTPLALSTWRGRTGLSGLPLLGRPDDRSAWLGRVRVEPCAFRRYARAVHAATDAFLARLAQEPRDLGPGEPMAQVLTALLLRLSTASTALAARGGLT